MSGIMTIFVLILLQSFNFSDNSNTLLPVFPKVELKDYLRTNGFFIYMGKRLTKDEFVQKARKTHGDKFDYAKSEYIISQTDVEIICSIHGSFWQQPNNHINGQGCPVCGDIKCGKSITSNTTEFIEKAKKVHGEKYNYDKVVYVKAIKKVIITCPLHGDFPQQPNNHLTGYGCAKCRDEEGGKRRLVKIEDFIKRASNKHNNKYDYSLTEIKGDNTELIKIICPKHGEFEQQRANHLQGKGCQKCAQDSRNELMSYSTDVFIQKAKEVHGDLYDYSKSDYTGNHTSLIIICPFHGEFNQVPHNHLSGCGCQVCAEILQTALYRNKLDHEDVFNIPCKLYICKLSNDNESFYKVGISKNTNSRFAEIDARYKREMIIEFDFNLHKSVTIEQQTLNKLKAHRYYPKIYFAGETECLIINPLSTTEEFIKEYDIHIKKVSARLL